MATSTAGNDRLLGTEQADLIRGLGGNDTIEGFEGDDTLDGGDGVDSIEGGDGDDSLLGGSGNDSIYGGAGNNSLQGGAGNDLLETEDDADFLDGGDGNDTLNAGDGEDRVFGGAGADQVFGLAGDDSVDGGTGNDSVEGGPGFDTLLGGDGEDSLSGGEGSDSIYGGLNDDYLDGGGDADLLDGEDGNDRIESGDGDDTLKGGSGNDLMAGDVGDDSLDGGIGNDTLSGGFGFDTIDGGDGNDYLAGEEENDLIRGGPGKDSILGGNGEDTILGGADGDTIDGGDGDDLIYASDSIGAQGENTVSGGDGSDTLFGGLGADFLEGGDGRDLLNGDDGHDVLEGGNGDDVLNGDFGNDTMTGDSGDDTIHGGFGNDQIIGGPGADLLRGGDGSDSIEGSEDSDSLWGGLGNDTLEGGEGDDFLYGEAGDDSLLGGAGDDSFFESPGNDHLNGGVGSDSVFFSQLSTNYQIKFDGDRLAVASPLGYLHLIEDVELIGFLDRSFGLESLRDLVNEKSESLTSPIVQFNTATFSSNEGNSGTSTITVQAALSTASNQTVTLPISYSGTATSGTDYTNATTSISIPAGQTTGTATFSIVGDTAVEPNESVVLTMGTPSNAILGANTVYTHMIVNDDTFSTPAIPSGIFLSPSGYIAADSAKVNVYGTAGVETVLLGAGSSSVVLDQNVDRIYLSEAPSAYRFQQSGITLDGYSLNGSGLVFSAALQADADGTVLVFPGGTASAKVSASGMRIGDVLVPSSAPTSILPTLSAYVAPPTGPSGAGVFLSQGASFVAASSGLSLYGAIGIETVSLKQGVSGIELDQAVERVQFDGLGTAGLRFQQQGINLLVSDASTLLARVPLQTDADGTLITTADGTMQAKVSATGMRLGGALVSQTVPGAVVPTEVDTSIKAPSDDISTSVPMEVTVGAGIDLYYDASKADVTFNINLLSTLEFTIARFGSGDKIVNPRGVQPVITRQSNSTDGQITLDYGSGIVKVTLIGLTEEQDRQILGVNDLNKVFGTGTLT